MKKVLAVLITFASFAFAQSPTPPVMKSGTVHYIKSHATTKVGLIAKATLHQVNLTCTASTSTDVTGYNFYRGTTAGGESTTPLNPSPVASCAYTDTNVVGLGLYFYTAKAYAPTASPNLSIASNEVSVTVPGDPQPSPPVMNTPTSN